MARTRIYLIRHADVENPLKLLYGHLDGFQLSALGRAQAEALGDRLRPADIKRIVHSPLSRAVETANLLARGYDDDDIRGIESPWGVCVCERERKKTKHETWQRKTQGMIPRGTTELQRQRVDRV